MTGRGTNTYILGHGTSVVVIDPGPSDPLHLANIEAAVLARGHAAIVLLTHHHPDHSEAGAEVAHRLAAPLAAIPHPLSPRLDRDLRDGERLQLGGVTLEVMATPGHCRDHACYTWEQAGAVFVGDLVAGEGYIVIDPPEGDMRQYLDSLGLVRDRRFNTRPGGAGAPAVLLPGHGPAIEHPREYLEGYIAHRVGREERVWRALEPDTPRTLQELLPRAYDDTPETMYPVAARSLQAHLDKLVQEGRAEAGAKGFRRLS